MAYNLVGRVGVGRSETNTIIVAIEDGEVCSEESIAQGPHAKLIQRHQAEATERAGVKADHILLWCELELCPADG